jgi:SCY1-like protein 2
MFSSALKSFSSNISSNYTIAPQPSGSSGPWKIFDAKRKQGGKAASIFVFDKKSLEPQSGGLGGRSSATSLKRAHEEVLERLKKEASNLARLRHPSILELQEPVEETRHGGLQFATEPVSASLAGLLQEKDEQERPGGATGRASRFVVEESDGTLRRRELEIDELEIQKGLLQLGKGLEFLHESAGLVHANLTPDAILINAKGDWKISGLSFTGPHESSTSATSLPPISLYEVLNHDPRLPRGVQINIDYTSPDFVLDNTLTASADMFSLGLLILALYNSPHSSPLSTGGSLSSYKRVFSSSSTVPTMSNNFLIPKSHPLPPKLSSELLPRLITRRPAQRLSAREFQEASYFDNILVSTIRFLDALPAKTANEKLAFMRGLPKITPQFPKSVLEKKVLPALLEELKDKELLAPILTNVFAMIKAMPSGKRAFTEKVAPRLTEIFAASKSAERDTTKEAGLMVLLENMDVAATNCSGKEFRDDILPIILLALESPTHALVDVTLTSLPSILPVLDFSTIKNELFPAIANVFAKTSSLNIKIRGLEAFYTLCGGKSNAESGNDDDLNGIAVPDKKPASTASSFVLDKYTVQEKVVPMLKGIKTREPGVMMAALKVFRQVGEVADTDFLAMDVLPVLWSMSLGPLLNLQQFQSFMSLIKNLGGRIEREQTRKLQEMSGGHGASATRSHATGRGTPAAFETGSGPSNGEETDFESLVSGRKNANSNGGDLMNGWGTPEQAAAANGTRNAAPTFSWQSAPATAPAPAQQPRQASMASLQQPNPSTRAITPDLASFASLTPSSQFSQPLQPNRPMVSQMTNVPMRPAQPVQQGSTGNGTSLNWSAASNASKSFNLPPPPMSPQGVGQQSSYQFPTMTKPMQPQQQKPPQNGNFGGGLDKYESLL